MKNAVVLLSGGIDSSTLLHYVKNVLDVADVGALSFRYGQKHSCELNAAEWQANAVGVTQFKCVDVSCFGELTHGGSALTDPKIEVPDLTALDRNQLDQPPTYVPNRNMMFLSLAAAWAETIGVQDVFYGAQAQDRYGYWDCTVDFAARINDVLALNRRLPVQVHSPLAEKSKKQVVELGAELGVDFAHTWSCYRGSDLACGRCPTCIERKEAFEAAGVDDPLCYIP